jgi:geranylgeranyl diphosphate synthase type I
MHGPGEQMYKAEEIKKKLNSNAKKIDSFIAEVLIGRKPDELYKASRYILESGGKRLRPYMTVKTCELFGGTAEQAIPFASAMEILHNFTLIHDDVMDHDELRRGNPTVHKKYGTPLAILAGDLLYTKVYQIFVNHIPEKLCNEDVVKIIQRITDSTILLCEGQALDILYPKSTDIDEKDYLLMVGGKTGALFSASAEVGAIVGRAREEERLAISKFAWDAGVAFQIVDDILGITSTEEKLGKPVGSDIIEGKKTLIIIHALKNANHEQKETILKVLGKEGSSKKELITAIEVIHETGSIIYAQDLAKVYLDSSLEMLTPFPDSEAKKDLIDLIEYFVDRKY